MDSQKVKRLIEKITRLHQTLEKQQGSLDPIERDLMLNYLRQLYDEFYFPPKGRPVPETRTEEKAAPKEEPRVIEIQEGPSVPPPPQPKPEPPEPEPRPEPAAKQQQPPSPPEDARFESLFQHEEARELGDRLRSAPIDDLQRAFAINDRLLFTNELFGKDNQAFLEALSRLDRQDSFQEAKGYLRQMAVRYDWLEEEKLPRARDFVQTIRRRYLR